MHIDSDQVSVASRRFLTCSRELRNVKDSHPATARPESVETKFVSSFCPTCSLVKRLSSIHPQGASGSSVKEWFVWISDIFRQSPSTTGLSYSLTLQGRASRWYQYQCSLTQERPSIVSSTAPEEGRIWPSGLWSTIKILQCAKPRVLRGFRHSCCVLSQPSRLRPGALTENRRTMDIPPKQFRTQEEPGELWTNNPPSISSNQGWQFSGRAGMACFCSEARILRCWHEGKFLGAWEYRYAANKIQFWWLSNADWPLRNPEIAQSMDQALPEIEKSLGAHLSRFGRRRDQMNEAQESLSDFLGNERLSLNKGPLAGVRE